MPHSFKLRDRTRKPPGGYVWNDPITGMRVDAPFFNNWLTLITEHRIGNSLPVPTEPELEDYQCRRYDEKTRQQFCMEMDGDVPVEVLGVGGTLKQMLRSVGVKACSNCTNLAGRMDAWGPDGCEEHMDEIVSEIGTNANQTKWMKYLPFKDLGAKSLVQLAINEVRNRR